MIFEVALLTDKLRGEFVKFIDDSSYGGTQYWFYELLNMPEKNITGCACIAAVNIILYYAQTHKFSFIKNPEQITKRQFIETALEFYENYIPQTIQFKNPLSGKGKSYGVWFMESFSNGITAFAKEQKIKLISHICTNSYIGGSSYSDAVQFIKNGLLKDCPIILFVRYNRYAKSLRLKSITNELHFVTITRINVFDEDCSLVISTWGRKTEIPSLKTLWQTKHLINIMYNVSLAYYELG